MAALLSRDRHTRGQGRASDGVQAGGDVRAHRLLPLAEPTFDGPVCDDPGDRLSRPGGGRGRIDGGCTRYGTFARGAGRPRVHYRVAVCGRGGARTAAGRKRGSAMMAAAMMSAGMIPAPAAAGGRDGAT